MTDLTPGVPTPRRKQKKTKTYSGCWTCRARRVKCDEQRPICARCSRSRLECEGYGVRLLWTNARGADRVSTTIPFDHPIVSQHSAECENSRTSMHTARESPFQSSQHDIASPTSLESPVSRLERRESLYTGDAHKGPPASQLLNVPSDTQNFSTEYDSSHSDEAIAVEALSHLFTAHAYHDNTHGLPASRIDRSDRDLPPPILPTLTHDADITSGAELSDQQIHHRDLTQFPLHGTSSFSSGGPLVSSDNITAHRVSCPLQNHLERDLASFEGLGHPEHHEPPAGTDQIGIRAVAQTPLRHIDELTVPSCQKDLIHHWIFFLCKNMVPVDLVDNLFRVVYLPFAFKGIDSPVTQSSSNLAIFHGLCAVSAESQIYLNVAKPGVTKLLAARHNRLALQHLQKALKCPVPKDGIDSVLSAILICILRDTVTGESRNWRGHVQGALSCLPKPNEIEIQPGSNLHIALEQFLCLAVFGDIETKYDLDQLIAQLPDTTSYMTQFHNISKFTLRAVLAINAHAHRTRHGQSNAFESVESRNYGNSTDLGLLELQIYLQAPTNKPLGTYARSADTAVSMHYSHVHYYALLIHFQRVVHNASGEAFDEMVEAALSHLEISEELGGGCNGCILLWPCLVIAAECKSPCIRARILAWFGLKRRHGFKSVDLGPDILASYWNFKDQDSEKSLYTSWQAFIKGTKHDIVPL